MRTTKRIVVTRYFENAGRPDNTALYFRDPDGHLLDVVTPGYAAFAEEWQLLISKMSGTRFPPIALR